MKASYKQKVDAFLSKEVVAVVGVTGKGDSPANYICEKFKGAGYHCYPVNRSGNAFKGETIYRHLNDLPVTPEAVMLCTPPKGTLQVLNDCALLNIQHAWVHRSITKGSWHSEAREIARKHKIELIESGCPMMFIRPDGFHRLLCKTMSFFDKLN